MYVSQLLLPRDPGALASTKENPAYVVNGVGRLHLEGDSLAREGLHENLHDGDLDSGVVVVLSREEKEVFGSARSGISQGSVRRFAYLISVNSRLGPPINDQAWVSHVLAFLTRQRHHLYSHTTHERIMFSHWSHIELV